MLPFNFCSRSFQFPLTIFNYLLEMYSPDCRMSMAVSYILIDSDFNGGWHCHLYGIMIFICVTAALITRRWPTGKSAAIFCTWLARKIFSGRAFLTYLFYAWQMKYTPCGRGQKMLLSGRQIIVNVNCMIESSS